MQQRAHLHCEKANAKAGFFFEIEIPKNPYMESMFLRVRFRSVYTNLIPIYIADLL